MARGTWGPFVRRDYRGGGIEFGLQQTGVGKAFSESVVISPTEARALAASLTALADQLDATVSEIDRAMAADEARRMLEDVVGQVLLTVCPRIGGAFPDGGQFAAGGVVTPRAYIVGDKTAEIIFPADPPHSPKSSPDDQSHAG
jgi:hypothetical protein